MRINIERFLALKQKHIRQPAGMIPVRVAENNLADAVQVFMIHQRVVNDRSPFTGIKKKIAVIGFDMG